MVASRNLFFVSKSKNRFPAADDSKPKLVLPMKIVKPMKTQASGVLVQLGHWTIIDNYFIFFEGG